MYPILYTAYNSAGSLVHVVVVRRPGIADSLDYDGPESLETDAFDDPQVGIGHLRASFSGERNVKIEATEAEIERALAMVQDEIDDLKEDRGRV